MTTSQAFQTRRLMIWSPLVLASSFVFFRLVFEDINIGQCRVSSISNNISNSIVPESKLLPRALDLLRHGVSLEAAYNYKCPPPARQLASDSQDRDQPIEKPLSNDEELRRVILDAIDGKQKTCSCQGSKKNDPICCHRCLFWTHKQGAALIKKLFEPYTKDHRFEFCDFEGNTGIWHDWANDRIWKPTTADSMDIIVLRNVKDSLISGYLYHKSGKECWSDWYGNQKIEASPFTEGWQRFVPEFDTPPHRDLYPTLCHYLTQESEEEGMAAYIQWVFKAYYDGPYTQWALSQRTSCSRVQERTRTICFEDLDSNKQGAVQSVLDFWNGVVTSEAVESTPEANRTGQGTNVTSYKGGHSTSKDPELRQRLLRLIDDVDRQYYNGDIGWLDSQLPC